MNALRDLISRVLILFGSAIVLFLAICVVCFAIQFVWFPHASTSEEFGRYGVPLAFALFGGIISLFWGLSYLIWESIEARRKLSDWEEKIDKIRRDSETPEAVSDHPTAKNSTKSSKKKLIILISFIILSFILLIEPLEKLKLIPK